MYRMFYRGQFIGCARNAGDGFMAWFPVGDDYRYAFNLKNKSAAKRWLTEQWMKHNPEAQ